MLAALSAVLTASAITFATNPPPSGFSAYETPPPTSGVQGLISRTDISSGGFPFTFRRVADDFAPTLPGYLSAIEWWGAMESDTGSLANVASFTIEIFTTAAGTGLPASSVYTTTLPLNSTKPQLVTPVQTVGLLNAPMYHFITPNLTSALVQINQGQNYWLSISANLVNPPSASNEAWAWASGINPSGNTLICQDRFDGQGFQLRTLAVRNTGFRVILNIGGPPPTCPGDTNADGDIDSADLSVVLANFGATGIPPQSAAAFGDFNSDGNCDSADLSVLLAQFANACP